MRGSPEIPLQHPAIDLRQLLQVCDRRALVDLMHGLADQSELDHRAIVRDEARIRGAARGRELRPAARHLLDCRYRKLGKWTGLGHEHVRVRGLPYDARADTVAGCLCQPLLDELA